MGILKITLSSFRNHNQKELGFGEGLTVIWGDNGSGKTSLLEAIHLLSYGKSFKTHKQKELIKNGLHSYIVRGTFKKNNSTDKVDTEFGTGGAQKTKINGKLISSRKEQVGRNPVVILSPEEQEITKGGPSQRRSFFDRVFSVVNKEYLNTLQSFFRLLKQRNASLVRIREGKVSTGEIYGWDEQIGGVASSLLLQRDLMIEKFKESLFYVQSKYDINVEVEISYKPNIKESLDYKQVLLTTQETDISMGRTTRGPHRDEIDMLWRGAKIRSVGSQGEHKLSLVFLKLSEVMFIKEKTGSFPTLLLDDLFAKLDLGRSRKLVKLIGELEKETGEPIQTIVTTTDIVDIEQSGILSENSNATNHRLSR